MTNEEAKQWIEILIRTMREETSGSYPDPLYKDEVFIALEMANKALEQQPCEDVVRRLIKDKINTLEDIASTENSEGRWVEYEKCCYAIEVLEKLFADLEILPPVTPKEKTEYEHDHEVVKAYNDGQAYILDKIRTEIEDIPNNEITKPIGTYDYCTGANNERKIILEIIDKYRGDTDD